MIYFKDALVTVWKVEDKGKYSIVSLSSGRKDKKTEKYVNSNWTFVRFVGEAHEKAQELKEKDRIKINGGFSWEPYTDENGERKFAKTPSLVVFNFGYSEDKLQANNPDKPPVVEDDSDNEELPF